MKWMLSPVRACFAALLLLAWSGSLIPAVAGCLKPARGHACSCHHRGPNPTRGGDCCMRMSPEHPAAITAASAPRPSLDPACIAVSPADLCTPAPAPSFDTPAVRPPAPPPERLLTTQLLL